jgi:small subunit ribosomal protein S13
MPRIAGVDIPTNKIAAISLTYIFGVGRTSALRILKEAQIDPNKRVSELSADEVNRIQGVISNVYKVEGELRREVGNNIKRLKDITAWRGSRHIRRLPIHGRTKTNSRTTRGNVRKTMGSGRRPPASPT